MFSVFESQLLSLPALRRQYTIPMQSSIEAGAWQARGGFTRDITTCGQFVRSSGL